MSNDYSDKNGLADLARRSRELATVNDAVSKLAGKDRAKAVEILGKFGAMTTVQLRKQNYPDVLAAVSKELERFAS